MGWNFSSEDLYRNWDESFLERNSLLGGIISYLLYTMGGNWNMDIAMNSIALWILEGYISYKDSNYWYLGELHPLKYITMTIGKNYIQWIAAVQCIKGVYFL